MTYIEGCGATTKKGKPCPIERSKDSDFCHVHNADLQCGEAKRDGSRCNIPTGGVRCKAHRGDAPAEPSRQDRRPRYSPEERAARRADRKKAERQRNLETFATLAELDRLINA